MNTKWHKATLTCDKCSRELTILSLCASADMEIMLELVCAPCGLALQWKTHIGKLMASALRADIEEAFIASKIKAKPAAIVPPQNGQEQADDKKFLKDLHIIDPDDIKRLPGQEAA